jgi:hypothetical protein
MQKPSKKIYHPIPAETERIGKLVLDAAYKAHTVLGPGLLESVYQVAVKHVLTSGGTLAETEVKLPIMFEGVELASALKEELVWSLFEDEQGRRNAINRCVFISRQFSKNL